LINDASRRINADGKIVKNQPPGPEGDGGSSVFGGGGGQCVEIGDNKKTIIVGLESDPIGQSAHVMTKVERAGGTITS